MRNRVDVREPEHHDVTSDSALLCLPVRVNLNGGVVSTAREVELKEDVVERNGREWKQGKHFKIKMEISKKAEESLL